MSQFEDFHQIRRELKGDAENTYLLVFLLLFFGVSILGGLWARDGVRLSPRRGASPPQDAATL